MKCNSKQKIMVTGGAGFIGSAVVRMLIRQEGCTVVNVDVLNYAGDLSRLAALTANGQDRHVFYQFDICDTLRLAEVFRAEQPDAIMHLAAETHVDRSIDRPAQAVTTNVMGTFAVLEAARSYWQSLNEEQKAAFRFVHVSTDEVYGDLSLNAAASAEGDAYAPNSPYSASKAGADHLVRAWHQTYGLPVMLTHCCNNYGPYQHPEKLIPHMILNALAGKSLPVYGDGQQQREWIFVEDHARALWQVLQQGHAGETYHISTEHCISNIELVRLLCSQLDEQLPIAAGKEGYASLINHVTDRPGHDRRYALSTVKIRDALGWQPQVSLDEGLQKTVAWYLQHRSWWQHVLDQGYALGRQGLKV